MRVGLSGRLVHEQDRGVGEEEPCEGDPLELAAGQVRALGAQDRVVALRQRLDPLVDQCGACGGLDLGVGGVGSP
ncbi:hypothetical protein AXF14_01135 [Actinomyces radicidentis]|uniref:Uncharacterized protein n=1 Tax=Actinomyces radicidentis TaxID=111015 RepID=A0A0X8JDH8_ACTRD|nr:hypothetical protein AXF14_01135 [Actinomyces radicidentis]